MKIAVPAMIRTKDSTVLELVKNGVPQAELIIPAEASAEEKAASRFIAGYITKSTGAGIPIVSENKPGNALVKIYLGSTAMAAKYKGKLDEMLSDGYIIDFPKPNTMVIASLSNKGLDFAAFEFLERYVGIRWLFPGELGEYVPKKLDISVPVNNIIDEPGFISRRISDRRLWSLDHGPGNGDLQKWAYRMRYNSRVKFHHNLAGLLPPSKYTKSHPEFFPVIDGKRHLPSEDISHRYQPCFTTDSVDEAVKNIINEFAKVKTNNYTYSLGVNDIGGYCECPKCREKNCSGRNFLGLENCSNLYYPWVNKIASRVSQKYPDAKFGLLAYCNVIDPPQNNQVDPHVIPYICHETLSLLTPSVDKKNDRLLERWKKTGCQLGWYDYAYGKFYILPRVYPRYLAKVYKRLYDQNVRYYYSEAYPDDKFTEGPKLYVLFKTLWNPNVDVDKLIKEWCECAVGKEAASYLVKYYDFYEHFWTERIPETGWFKGSTNDTYLFFKSNAYLAAIESDDLNMLQKLLETTVKKAAPGKQKSRAEYILNGFLDIKAKIEEYLKAFVKLKKAKVLKVLYHSKFDKKNEEKWIAWQRKHSKGEFLYSGSIGYTKPGARGFDLAGSKNGPMCYTQTVLCAPDKIYRVSAWMLPQGLQEGSNATLIVRFKNSSNKREELSVCLGSINKNEWQNVEMTFLCPANEFSVVLFASNSSRGKVFFDEIKVEEVTESIL
jgi:Domain of unknown function (DUF4838)